MRWGCMWLGQGSIYLFQGWLMVSWIIVSLFEYTTFQTNAPTDSKWLVKSIHQYWIGIDGTTVILVNTFTPTQEGITWIHLFQPIYQDLVLSDLTLPMIYTFEIGIET